MATGCEDGKVSILECPDPLPSCVGVKSIVFNSNNTMTITLTNGNTYTSASLVGPKGAKGDTGATGATGLVVLHNDISDSATTGTTLEALKTYTLPANTLDTDESYIEIKARFRTSTANTPSSTKLAGIYFNGSPILTAFFSIVDTNTYEFTGIVSRVSNTAAKQKVWLDMFVGSFLISNGRVAGIYVDVAGLNFTTTGYDITAEADSVAAGDITCNNLTVTLFRK